MSGSIPPVTPLTAEAFAMLDHIELPQDAPPRPIVNSWSEHEAVEVQPSFCLHAPSPEKTLLLLDDDTVLCRRLNHVFDALGFVITTVDTVEKAFEFVRVSPPAFAVLAQRLKDGSGLIVMKALREERPAARIVMLTSYGNIATAVSAIRGGAVDYLVKPATDDDVVRAVLGGPAEDAATPSERPASANRVRWDHIQQIFELNDRNIAKTARRLGMHRRTLQRRLGKNAPC